uniref:Zgc:77056 n=1 Tax=Cyprinus carpio carpio TaxID=630221 RepID=A0A8C1A8S9_CYPCA
MSKKGNVSWVKPAEPSFLKKFKNDVGFKEGPTVETKKQQMPQYFHKSTMNKYWYSIRIKIYEQPPLDGKIVFKKPVKRSSDKFKGITASSSKKKSEDGEKKESKAGVKVKNNSLLSFGGGGGGDDDDDEED